MHTPAAPGQQPPVPPVTGPVNGHDSGHPPAGHAPEPQHPPLPTEPPAPPQAPPRQARTHDLTPERLLRGQKAPPTKGWRRALYTATAGVVNPGESKAELLKRELRSRMRTPVDSGHHRVAVLSLKGGVGKTTTTVGLGSVFAEGRGDRVIAVDANPDRGTLTERLAPELRGSLTVRDLLRDRDNLDRYADVRAYTSQAPSRLEFLASDIDPAVSEAFSADDYRSVASVVERFYSICITDCGTGMLHSAMSAILELADQMVLVVPPSVDGARSASATLDWLQAHGHNRLAENSVAVLSKVGKRGDVDLEKLSAHFTGRCRSVVRIPADRHLEQGSGIDLDKLHPATRHAYLLLAAEIASSFNSAAR
ncbi:MinD-like ATPase involved in chromosome partitioning or flagellar assembly [Murinocardiopsis flavida]|uniref:MinD-like ATPase involved in chromosome partitioning or flagellar assembly n=1 Tax=Murinocardiopsis flavida TaxID=645275 RepID=A0A2P8D244_9ACTN|nr:MinD/ParA family protein [Murinocardiopsis flavida]PSK91300.1 MinD-like ATPase involved in chromosome partitioning or flagellar assembly [Murinocardiopsis flavida]